MQSNNKPSNPPAFPQNTTRDGYPANSEYGTTAGGAAFGGITMRDYFAAKAMQASVSHYGMPNRGDVPDDYDPELAMKCLVEGAYLVADAMLNERMKGGEGNAD